MDPMNLRAIIVVRIEYAEVWECDTLPVRFFRSFPVVVCFITCNDNLAKPMAFGVLIIWRRVTRPV